MGDTRDSARLLADWQERSASAILTAIGLVALALMIWFGSILVPLTFAVGVLIVVALFAMAVWRGAPRRFRAGGLLVIFGYAAVASLFGAADIGGGVTYLTAGVLLAALLINARAAVGFLTFGAVVIAATAWSLATGVRLFPQASHDIDHATQLAGSAFTFFFVGLITVTAVHSALKRLRASLDDSLRAAREVHAESAARARALADLEAAHARLEESHAQLVHAEKMELIGRLAGGIAHDMNNALTVVLAESEYLRDVEPESAQNVADAVAQAVSLTNQLLALGRRDVAQPVPLDLAELVTTSLRMVRRVLGPDITVEAAPLEPSPVSADPSHLQQVLLNLATNAGHAMAGGGRLLFSVTHEGEFAVLTVSDTGEGMTQTVRAHIFDAFFTTKPRGKGTGLGLASVKSVVDGMGGDIGCDSTPGVGTTFRIRLPRLAQLPVSARGARHAPVVRLDGVRVLVAEDEPRVRHTLANALRDAGATVIEAHDAASAIALADLQAQPFDLAWCDVVMPGGGATLVRWLEQRRPATTLIIGTGYADDDVLREELALGRYTLVRKPFSKAEVLAACERALTRRQVA